MKRRIAILLCALLCNGFAMAQGRMFEWHSHLSQDRGVQLLECEGQMVYASGAGIVFPQNGIELNKVSGLSDIGISALYYYAPKDVFLVGYDNGNIEIVPHSVISTLSASQNIFIEDIKNSAQLQHKKINRFVCNNQGRCFVATDFGIVEIDADKGEIKDNFTIHPAGADLAVRDLVQFGTWWVAATDTGIFYCAVDNPQWHYFGSWQQTQMGSRFSAFAVFRDTLFILNNNGNLLSTTNLQSFDTLQYGVQMICTEHNVLWTATTTHLRNRTTGQVVDLQGFMPQSVIMHQSELWVADKNKGLLRYDGTAFLPQIQGKLPSNEVLHTAEHNGTVWAVGNGFIAQQRQNGWDYDTNSLIINPIALVINPKLPSQVWIATSSTILEYNGIDNCASIGAPPAMGAGSITAMGVSASGEMLVGCWQSLYPLHLRTTDGVWTLPTATGLAEQKITAISHYSNTFRGIAGENPSSIFAYSSNPERFASNPIVLRNDYTSTPVSATAILADRNGETWIGTNKGVAVYTSGNLWDAASQGRKVQTLSDMPGYAAYLLEYETVTTIAIDGGNRKWFGTATSGVFLQSADGIEPLHAFTTANSALPSNHILSIAVNGTTGEALIATDKGMVGFTADATMGADDFSEVKIYPNPVRPQSQWVTLTGLAEDASIKITNAAGGLIYEGIANGGTLTWDLQSRSGDRAATGVYFVFMLSGDGSQRQVGKVLVVK